MPVSVPVLVCGGIAVSNAHCDAAMVGCRPTSLPSPWGVLGWARPRPRHGFLCSVHTTLMTTNRVHPRHPPSHKRARSAHTCTTRTRANAQAGVAMHVARARRVNPRCGDGQPATGRGIGAARARTFALARSTRCRGSRAAPVGPAPRAGTGATRTRRCKGRSAPAGWVGGWVVKVGRECAVRGHTCKEPSVA